VDGFGREEEREERIRSLGEEERRRCGWRFPVAVLVILVIWCVFGTVVTINTKLQGGLDGGRVHTVPNAALPGNSVPGWYLIVNHGKLCLSNRNLASILRYLACTKKQSST
jgi:hypothetical protein